MMLMATKMAMIMLTATFLLMIALILNVGIAFLELMIL